MDEKILRKAFGLIAKGFVEKEAILKKEPNRYPHSRCLQHGINMFLAASVEIGKVGEKVWEYADEASFLRKFAELPVANWFDDWEPTVVAQMDLENEPFFGFGPLAMWEDDNRYTPSEDCLEYLESQDADILAGTDERVLYEKMIGLNQEHYTQIREFIIRNPIVSAEDLRNLKMQLVGHPNAIDTLNFAYETWEGEAYKCPVCGWTMTKENHGFSCHSRYCTEIAPDVTENEKINCDEGRLLRLKKGVMRYFAQPGKLELEIADYCEQFDLSYTLWPLMDTYDIEICFPDSEIWEIDAKAYHNPIALRNKVQDDEAFDREGFSHGYYVIPSAFVRGQKNYTKIVNQVLKKKVRVQCITSHTLKQKIRRKVDQLHEEK